MVPEATEPTGEAVGNETGAADLKRGLKVA